MTLLPGLSLPFSVSRLPAPAIPSRIVPRRRAVVALHRATVKVERSALRALPRPAGAGRADLSSRCGTAGCILSIQAHRGEGIVTMASQSKDGRSSPAGSKATAISVVRGSTTRGGGEALRRMVRAVRSGRNAALTVDGPKGPPESSSRGRPTGPADGRLGPPDHVVGRAAALPRLLGPVSASTPFSRGFVAYGEPFPIPSGNAGRRRLAAHRCRPRRGDRGGRRGRRRHRRLLNGGEGVGP